MTNVEYELLEQIIKGYNRVGICLSGGAASILLTVMAAQVLGEQNVVAFTARTDFVTNEDMEVSASLCAKIGVKHVIIPLHIMEDERILKNDEMRCKYCKKNVMGAILEASKGYNLDVLMDGSDVTYKKKTSVPEEKKPIISPLVEANVTSDIVHELLIALGLKRYAIPPSSCLATRIATGERITLKKLKEIRAAENYITSLGFKVVRFRVKGNNARIEVGMCELDTLFEQEDEICEELSNMGYNSVTIDPDGFKQYGLCMED